jgi:CDP-glucose 4,6-dehydratase
VIGYSLEPETKPSLFEELSLQAEIDHNIGDIGNFEKLNELVARTQPDLVLHLAAQPLVRRSYRIPRETFQVNTQGTANVLEAALSSSQLKGVLCITTDKVYKNNDSGRAFVESDELGGHDPYSYSKAAAEFVVASLRKTLYNKANFSAPLVVARGGNIIGGGDWSEDRIIPDFIRAWRNETSLEIRFPKATRPWQHVLALAEGYLIILTKMMTEPGSLSHAYNLGPVDQDILAVKDVLRTLADEIPGVGARPSASALGEAQRLQLDSTLAMQELGWCQRWDVHEAVRKTAIWYRSFYSGVSARAISEEQIDSWMKTIGEEAR